MQYFILKIFSIIIFLILYVNCGTENQKIYKQFDTVDISTTQVNPENESAWNGGPGFEVYAEQLGWETNNNVVSNGNPEATKGDTITIIGGRPVAFSLSLVASSVKRYRKRLSSQIFLHFP